MMEEVEPPFSGQAPEGHMSLAVTQAGSEPRTINTSHDISNVLMKPNDNKSKWGSPGVCFPQPRVLGSGNCAAQRLHRGAAGFLSQSFGGG